LRKKRRNLSIRDVITKVRKVLYHFEEEFPDTCASARRHKQLPKIKNENLIYLTPRELEALQQLELGAERERKVRDLFCFMAWTGLRYSDAMRVTKSHVRNVKRPVGDTEQIVPELHITTRKTTKLVMIPLQEEPLDLLKRNSYTFPDYKSAAFNRDIKRICAKLPELDYEMEITDYSGAHVQTAPHLKYNLISAHAARRTFVNLCLANGVSLETVRKLAGHSALEITLNSYTDADSRAYEQMTKIKRTTGVSSTK
jgi:integrase